MILPCGRRMINIDRENSDGRTLYFQNSEGERILTFPWTYSLLLSLSSLRYFSFNKSLFEFKTPLWEKQGGKM